MLFILTSFDKTQVGTKSQYFLDIGSANILNVSGSILQNESKNIDTYINFIDKEVIIPVIDGMTNFGVSITYVVERDGQVLIPFDTYFSRFTTLTNMCDITSVDGEDDGITDPSTINDVKKALLDKSKLKSKNLFSSIANDHFSDESGSSDLDSRNSDDSSDEDPIEETF